MRKYADMTFWMLYECLMYVQFSYLNPSRPDLDEEKKLT